MQNYTALVQSVLELDTLLDQLEPVAGACGVVMPVKSDWYDLLKRKLLPQFNGGLSSLALVSAVAGGTNTGKSLVFNHLAGENYSAVDYRASGTKHPVCLVPESSGQDKNFWQPLLEKQFDEFKLTAWENTHQPLQLSSENLLFWREGKNVPDGLVIIDTPDIDSDREINWERARYIRNIADVLIAVVTEQKYNDAAVRQFFREAAAAEKPVILLFNMLTLPDDLQYVENWKKQFCEQTDAEPIAVLVAPHDKEAAAHLNVPFYAFSPQGTAESLDLRKLLTDLRFDTIKLQTLEGALKVLDDPQKGVRSYFDTVENASNCFRDALKKLDDIGEMQVRWSGLPNSLLVEEIRNWWNERRPAWAQKINYVYRKAGQGLLYGAKKAFRYTKSLAVGGQKKIETSPVTMSEFKNAERTAVIEFVWKVVEQIKILSATDNPVLQRELAALTGGESREKMLTRAEDILQSMPAADDEFRETLDKRLTAWTKENPDSTKYLSWLDNAVTAARPLITLTLAASGAAVGAHIVGPWLTDMAVTAVGGEAALAAGSEGFGGSVAKLFRQIQEDYVISRSQRFFASFQKELWEDIKRRLQAGARVTDSEVFKKCRNWQSQ